MLDKKNNNQNKITLLIDEHINNCAIEISKSNQQYQFIITIDNATCSKLKKSNDNDQQHQINIEKLTIPKSDCGENTILKNNQKQKGKKNHDKKIEKESECNNNNHQFSNVPLKINSNILDQQINITKRTFNQSSDLRGKPLSTMDDDNGGLYIGKFSKVLKEFLCWPSEYACDDGDDDDLQFVNTFEKFNDNDQIEQIIGFWEVSNLDSKLIISDDECIPLEYNSVHKQFDSDIYFPNENNCIHSDCKDIESLFGYFTNDDGDGVNHNTLKHISIKCRDEDLSKEIINLIKKYNICTAHQEFDSKLNQVIYFPDKDECKAFEKNSSSSSRRNIF